MDNNQYNVNIYYNEDEVHAAFNNYYNDVKYNSVVHVFSKNSAPFAKYQNEENVLLHDSGNFFDKIRNWLAGESQFDDQFEHLRISPENRERYLNIIENGGTIVISNAAANTNPYFKPDHVANRERFADDFDYPTAAGITAVNLNAQDQISNDAITQPDDPMYQAVAGEELIEEDLSATNKESFPYEAEQNDVEFKAIEQDVASQETAQLNEDRIEDTNPMLTDTNKESFPYEPAEPAILDESESRTFGVTEEAQPTDLKFNPVQDPERNEPLDMAVPTMDDDIPLTFDDGHSNYNVIENNDSAEEHLDEVNTDSHELQNLSDEESTYFAENEQLSNGVAHEHYSQDLSPNDTISTFDTIASRNHSLNEHVSETHTDSTESVLQFDDQDANHALDQYDNEKQTNLSLNPFALKDEAPPANDTLHRSDENIDEENYQQFADEENYSHMHDDTIGKATEFRRHDLP